LADANDQSAWQQFEQCYQSAIYRMARNRGLHSDEALDDGSSQFFLFL
jgi:hypothetical protein